MLTVEDLRRKQEQGMALNAEAQAVLDADDEKVTLREAERHARGTAAVARAERSLADYAEAEAAHREVMELVVASTKKINAAYEEAYAAAQAARRHGYTVKNPLRIHVQQDYETRTLCDQYRQATRGAA
jgi:hypothetical protein